MNATEKRFAAIRMIMDRYVDENGVRLLTDSVETRIELVACIRLLARAGRTERWQSAVKRWAAMVANPSNDLDWAMLQGQIFAGYGAL